MYKNTIAKLALISLAALALAPLVQAQAQLAGDWQGTISAGDAQFRIVWHVVAAQDGSITSTLDNLDQGILAIPVKSTTLKDSTLTLIIDDNLQANGESVHVHGNYTGTVNKTATEIAGIWTQLEPVQPSLELTMKRAPAPTAVKPAQSSIVGDWQGTLSAGGAQLRLALHIAAAKDGSLTAMLDSIDQGANGIQVTTITLKDSQLSLTVDAVHGGYEGTVNKDASEIDGTWSQGQPLELNWKRGSFAAAPPPKPAAPSDIDGSWLGTLDAGAVKLRLIFKIVNTADGLTAQMQSPDQAPNWISATKVKRDGSKLTIEITSIGVVYECNISADLTSIEGSFTQMGNPLPLKLKRIKDQSELQLRRPQNPVKPYPYREEEVSYTGKAAGVTLAATLTIPPGKGPFPAVLLIAGSGPNDRDETVFGHKPFLVLSDYLTRKGIVVLRADKRGIGKSTGDLAKATTADFAIDAEAGVAFLKTRSEVDPRRIGLIGHSEGGMVAPMVAARNSDVAFIVMMAGDGVPGDQIIVEQVRLLAEVAGASQAKAAEAATQERDLLDVIVKEQDPDVLEKALHTKLLADSMQEEQIGASIKALTSPWFRYTLTYDPATALRKVACPVLALNGSLDLQVPPAQNLPAIRKALEEGGNKHFEADELPGLNHLFQTAKTGSPTEYGQIEETISPMVLDKIASWILKQ